MRLLNLINNEQTNSAFERVFALMFIIQNKKFNIAVCGDLHWTTFFTTTFTNYLFNKHNYSYWLSPMTKIFS